MSESLKYGRTFHAPWSKGATNDDKVTKSMDSLLGVPIVITEKIDGGNASLEREGCYARTHANIPNHPSFDHLKALHSTIKYKIPEDIQLFGENCYCKHSIHYSQLPGYFLLFNVRDLNKLIWASWEEVELWADEIGVSTVPVLFKGIVNNENELHILTDSFMKQSSCCGGDREGVVIRIQESFSDDLFYKSIIKVVRANHVNPDNGHWKSQEIIKNNLKNNCKICE